MRQSCFHVAINHHAALPSQISRENNVRLPLGDCGGNLQRKRPNRKAARALIRRILVLVARWIIELFTCRVNKYRILGPLAKVDFRPGEPKARRFDLWGSVLDEQDGQAVGSNLVDLCYDYAKAVGVNEAGIDPALARLGGQLGNVDFARRKQDLLNLAIDEIAFDISVGESVVGAQRLNLRDGCFVCA